MAMRTPAQGRAGVVLVAVAAWLALCAGDARLRLEAQTPDGFAALVASLSEPGGYFDTDNLISNEVAYLDVLPDFEAVGLRGGAYVGVGPDQNFSYIAAIEPDIAFIVDIRRDNLLLHLLFKALFTLCETRSEYLAWLLGRTAPAAEPGAGIEILVRTLDSARPAGDATMTLRRAAVDRELRRFGVPLSDEDLDTIARFHSRFVQQGLDLQFNTTGRPPQRGYPTYRQLVMARAPDGTPASFVSSERRYRIVRNLQQTDRIVPVIGDLSGPHALGAIGDWLRVNNQQLSAFYASNVEFYLFRQGAFLRFVENLRDLPLGTNALLIRSVFGSTSGIRTGSAGSISITQPLQTLLQGVDEGRFRAYWELTVTD